MGLFPDENINWYQKLAVMIRNRLLASAGQLLQLWRAWPTYTWLPCPPALWVCSTSSFVDLLPTALQGKSKSSARLKKKHRYIYSQKTPEKIAQNWAWQGIATPSTVVMVTDWLRPPCFKMVVGLDLDTNRHGIRISPGVNHPHDTTPLVPLRRGGKGPQDAPRGFHRFCSDLWNNINFHAAARHPPPIQEWFKCVQKRHSTTSYSISLLSG